MRGGEKVLEALLEMYPDADIFTHVYRPGKVSDIIRARPVTTTFIDRLPFSATLYRKYLPLMPLALEQLDLRAYDLVISSEAGPAKGVLTRPDALHICYCHTPMRYAWNMYHEYLEGTNWLIRTLMPQSMHRLRLWDFQAAARVDAFAGNSRHVARQIRKFYRRDATVIHPPVDIEKFAPSAEIGDYYLWVGQFTRYKRPDLAIDAFNALARPLLMIGDGEELAKLRKKAGPTIRILGRQDDAVLRHHYARCRALIFTAEEDFGIVPIEAMASGRPVLAFRGGGALETVIEGVTGLFFHRQDPECLMRAVSDFEATEATFDTRRIIQHAKLFAPDVFKRRFLAFAARAAAAQRLDEDRLWQDDLDDTPAEAPPAAEDDRVAPLPVAWARPPSGYRVR
jgi:glycosyltransferase involved in cell wall biosynthesis